MINDAKRHAKLERRRAERLARETSAGRTQFWSRVGWFTGGPLLIVAGFLAWNAGWFGAPASEHPYAEFAQCLSDEGLVMYGTDWCPHCQDQKQMFEDAFEFIEFVNCDFNKTTCQSLGVTGYPTWFYQGEKWADGVQAFGEFAEISGCSLPEGVGGLSEVTISE